MKNLNLSGKVALLAVFAVLFGTAVVLANDGDIDTTYGTNGLSVTTGVAGAVDVAIQTDGKAVVLAPSGNNFAVLRFNTDGSLDSSFGANGMTVIDFKSPQSTIETQDIPNTILIEPNGAILLAGSTEPTFASHGTDFALVRLNRNGTIDTSFGKKGFVITDFSHAGDAIYDLAVQDNGKILAVGKATVSGNVRFAVARYLDDGSLDPNFSTDGKKNFGFGGGFNIAFGVGVQDDGKIVMTGLAGFDENTGLPREYSTMARLRRGGNFDLTFGSNGKVIAPPYFEGGSDVSHSRNARPVIQSDGKIVVTGFYGCGSFGVARYNGSDGSLDATFGDGGLVIPNVVFQGIGCAGPTENRRIALDGGNIIFGGWAISPDACNGQKNRIVLFRYDSAGDADATFGTNGVAEYTPYPDPNDCTLGIRAESFALQPDGKIVTAGHLYDGTGPAALTLARFIN
jgi:uncharacterized delta-60 repeat protein